MTNYDFIIYLCGSAVGGAVGKSLIDKALNKTKDDLEIQLKEQVFYKTLIEDMTKRSESEKLKIEKLENKIELLTKEIKIFIELDKKQQQTIKDQKNLIERWENNSIKQKQQIDILIKELERYKSKVNESEIDSTNS